MHKVIEQCCVRVTINSIMYVSTPPPPPPPPPHDTCKYSTECPPEDERESSVTRNADNCIQTHSCCAHGRTILVEYKDMFLTIYHQWLYYVFIHSPLPQIPLPDDVQPRAYHTITAFSLGPGLTKATMFGGCPDWVAGKTNDQLPKLSETTVLQLGKW